MKNEQTIDVELYLCVEEGIEPLADGEISPISMVLTCEIEPYIPASGPTYSSGGEPSSGGYAEACELHVLGPDQKLRSISGLLYFLPLTVIEAWQERAYAEFESVGPPEREYERDDS